MGVENSQKHESSMTTSSMVHYCRVCKRRFHCAGALGGHMRSHGVGDDVSKGHDKEHKDEYVGKSYRSNRPSEGQKHSYFLRTNTNRFVINRVPHQKDEDRDNKGTNESVVTLLSSSSSPRDDYCASREEEDLANCLVMLSSNGLFVSSTISEDDEDNHHKGYKDKEVEINKGMFQCKACKKVFNSHQALGGHRASHKKVKGCYAAKLDNLNNNNNFEESLDVPAALQDSNYSLPSRSRPQSATTATTLSRKRSRVHQCSICHRIFSSGQALGGHKRCHWLASGVAAEATLIQNFQEITAYDHTKSPSLIFKNPAFTPTPHHQDHHPSLDLNFPPLTSQPDTAAVGGADTNNIGNPTRSYLQLWGNEEVCSTNTNTNHSNHQNPLNIQFSEEKSKVKAQKLSDLKDLKFDGGSAASGWLQVGIASAQF